MFTTNAPRPKVNKKYLLQYLLVSSFLIYYLLGGGDIVRRNKTKKEKLLNPQITKQLKDLITFVIGMTVAITTIAKNILDIFK